MDFINKTYKNRLTGDSFTIIDQYQNVAITSNKEKINTVLLQNDKLFIETSASISPPKSINESSTFQKSEDLVDPTKFFDNQITYDTFAQSIKNVDLSKVKDDNSNQGLNYPNNLPVSNESAIIMSDPEDEIEELKRKYGATTVDNSVRKQNEVFSRILDPQQEPEQVTQVQVNNVQQIEANREYVEPDQPYIEPPIQRIDVQDPIISMFKNVKRNLDFKINLKVDGKIPRLDFIEMMEDSYEISIIEFLADEFTEKLLNDPSIIRNQIINEIKSMIDKKNGVSLKKDVNPQITDAVTIENDVKPVVKKTSNRSKKTIPPPPSPPKNRMLKEGKESEPPKNMNA
jgi:hypothetical protein